MKFKDEIIKLKEEEEIRKFILNKYFPEISLEARKRYRRDYPTIWSRLKTDKTIYDYDKEVAEEKLKEFIMEK